jgi:hypothetical protein
LGFWDYHPPDDTPIATPAQISTIIKTLKLDPKVFGIIVNILKPPTWKRESVSLSRPDIYALNPFNMTAVIEVKIIEPKVKIEPWFDPAKISDGQRAWLDMWCYDANGHGYLAIGTIEGSRRLWIYPWEHWVNLEKKLGEKDIDFRIKISDLSNEWELTRVTGGWQLPNFHPLLAIVIPQTSPTLLLKDPKAHSFRFKNKEPIVNDESAIHKPTASEAASD